MKARHHARRHARDVIVMGASAGGFEALRLIFSRLPADLHASIAVALHRSPTFVSRLAELLGRDSKLEIVEPIGGESFQPGRVYVAPRDAHMTIQHGHIHLDRGPKQHHARPAIDPLFQSVAHDYGDRVIGVLLTGRLSDGVSGLISIKAAGGLSLVQDPDEAEAPSMPMNALLHDHVDVTFRIAGLSDILKRLVDGESVETVAETDGVRAVGCA